MKTRPTPTTSPTLPLALFALLLLTLALGGCGPLTFTIGGNPARQQLQPTIVASDGRSASKRVAVIDVSGLILDAHKPELIGQGRNPVSDLHEQLRMARRDNRVKAVVLRLNTPGGAVTASDIMYREIRRFRRRTHKPVVALMMDVTASGGYYVACASDHLIAYPTTVTGSIGVIFQTISLEPALNHIGIRTDAIVSGPNKEAGSPLSTLTKSQRKVLKNLVENFYHRFLKVVRRARPNIPEDHFDQLTDGRVLSGVNAAKAGLVDRIGDLPDAVHWAEHLAGLQHADVVAYHRPLEYVGSPYAAAPAGATGRSDPTKNINLMQLNLTALPGLDTPVGFYYLWQPHNP